MNALFLILLLNVNATHGSIKIADVVFKGELHTHNHSLYLNGAGVKTKLFFNLYVAGLYLEHKTSDPLHIQNSDSPMALKIVVVNSWVNSNNFRSAVDDWFYKSTKGNLAPIKERIEKFKNAFGNTVKLNDEILMIYFPKVGLKIYKNNVYQDTVPGLDFKREMAKLWLGDHPVSESLKNGLLGIAN